MRTVFMGTPDFALPVLEGLLHKGHQVIGVYTRPDRPAGRGRRVVPSPVKTYAVAHGLAVFQPTTLRRQEAAEELSALNPEVGIVAAYGRLLPAELLAVPPLGVLNIHPSLLPKYRGPSPVGTAILEGETETGVTVMRMDQGMDTGPILGQRQVHILPGETAGELTRRLFGLGAELLLELLPAWKVGDIKPVPQDEAKATHTRLFSKEDGELDWALPALVLERRLRAFQPWPGCYTRWEGRMLKVIKGAALADSGPQGASDGQVLVLVGESGPSVGVVTGQGVLTLTTVQLEGRLPQPAGAFARGYPRLLGARLPS